MPHPKIEDLSTYLDREMPVSESRRVEAHLEQCASCRHHLQALETVARRLGALEYHAPPEGLGLRLRELSSREAFKPNLFAQLEKGASRLNTALVPMFGVVVALLVIVYLFAWGLDRERGAASSAEPGSVDQVSGGVTEPSQEIADGEDGLEERQVAGRRFRRIGDIWVERGLETEAEVAARSPDDPEVERWLSRFPELRELSELGGTVRLRLEGRTVEIHFPAMP